MMNNPKFKEGDTSKIILEKFFLSIESPYLCINKFDKIMKNTTKFTKEQQKIVDSFERFDERFEKLVNFIEERKDKTCKKRRVIKRFN